MQTSLELLRAALDETQPSKCFHTLVGPPYQP